jgi:two-component system, cell cycle sensor histidine kinase and response regulator CckA
MIEDAVLVEAIPATAFLEAESWGRPETILLVEDELFVRRVTAEVLEAAGYRLVIARSGAEALNACRKSSQPFDLLLADVVMPGMSGRELADEYEGLCPHARVLLMSGYAGQLEKRRMPLHRNAYLAKPFSVSELLRKVREALDANPFAAGTVA